MTVAYEVEEQERLLGIFFDTISTVLYAHLGGQPALSAYGALFC